tara:strand:- start:401 stop:1366 length:966 start_codon:yes stop_codon:yes gene_type:complete
MKPLFLIAGIILGIIIIFLFHNYYIPYFFPYLTELENSDNKNFIMHGDTFKQELHLIKGILPFNSEPIEFKTDPIYSKDNNYVNLHKSVNLVGGTQFTYSFWLNKNKQTEFKDIVILEKGYLSGGNNSTPKIKFGNNSGELEISFKIYKGDKISNDNEKTMKIDSGVSGELFKLTNIDEWSLITITFQDSVDDNGIKNGVNVSVYLNDVLLKSEDFTEEYNRDANNIGTLTAAPLLKLNENSIHILPHKSDEQNYNNKLDNSKAELADIKYYNYALTQLEISKNYKKGINNIMFKKITNKDNNIDDERVKYLQIDLLNRNR